MRGIRPAQPVITVRAKTVKQRLRCRSCGGRMEIGSIGHWVHHKPKWYHSQCVPADALDGPKPKLPTSLSEAKSSTLIALENALVLCVKSVGITDEMRKAFERYNKYKAVYLRPGCDQEGRQAFKLAIRLLTDVVFGA